MRKYCLLIIGIGFAFLFGFVAGEDLATTEIGSLTHTSNSPPHAPTIDPTQPLYEVTGPKGVRHAAS